MKELRIEIPAAWVGRDLFRSLLGTEIVLVLLDFVVNRGLHGAPGSLRRLFNMAREDSLAAWFSSVQMLVLGLVACLVFLHSRQRGAPRGTIRMWGVLALGFTYLAVDDGAAIHERIGSAVKAWRGPDLGEDGTSSGLGFFPSYPWQVVFGPPFAAFGLVMLKTALSELHRHRRLFLVGLACFVTAVILDFIEGLPTAHLRIASGLALQENSVRHTAKVCEEFLEAFGTSALLVSLLGHLANVAPAWRIAFRKDRA